jgi:hypothetical protein
MRSTVLSYGWLLVGSSSCLYFSTTSGVVVGVQAFQILIKTNKGRSTLNAEASTEVESPSSPSSRNHLAKGILGPPEPLQSLPVRASIRAFRATVPYDDSGDDNSSTTKSTIGATTRNFEMERLSMDPPIVLLRGVLTE